ncbi:MAG TPA: META domain-containing protein [Devosia sp.]
MLRKLVLAAIALLALATMARAADIVFTGEVTYRERTDLPHGAELWVSLVALPEGAVVASAASRIPSPAQSPLSFTLNVRTTALQPNDRYGLIAEIREGNRTLFRSAQAVPVDALAPSPTVLLVGFSPDPLPAATDLLPQQNELSNPLLDTVWMVTSIGGAPTLPETKVTLAIAPDRRAGGHSGCNNYFTETSFEEEPLRFGPIAGTKMACAPDVMAQEAALFAALAATVDFEAKAKALKLLDAAGVTLVGLVKAP